MASQGLCKIELQKQTFMKKIWRRTNKQFITIQTKHWAGERNLSLFMRLETTGFPKSRKLIWCPAKKQEMTIKKQRESLKQKNVLERLNKPSWRKELRNAIKLSSLTSLLQRFDKALRRCSSIKKWSLYFWEKCKAGLGPKALAGNPDS
jgi:hypothetical protein